MKILVKSKGENNHSETKTTHYIMGDMQREKDCIVLYVSMLGITKLISANWIVLGSYIWSWEYAIFKNNIPILCLLLGTFSGCCSYEMAIFGMKDRQTCQNHISTTFGQKFSFRGINMQTKDLVIIYESEREVFK